jgi:hypothetical protein
MGGDPHAHRHPRQEHHRPAQKAITEAIEEAGVKARIQGWSRTEIGPVEPTRRPWLRHDDDEDGDSDSPMGIPLPLKS